MSTLDKHADEFVVAERKLRNKIVLKCLLKFKMASGKGKAYDEMLVETVNTSSAEFQVLFSHTSLAYSPVLARKTQTGNKGVHSNSTSADASGSEKVCPPHLLIDHYN